MFSRREFGVTAGAGKHAMNGRMELLRIHISVQLFAVLEHFNNAWLCMALQASLVFFGIADLICRSVCRPDQAQKKDQRPDISSRYFHDVLLEIQGIRPVYEECFYELSRRAYRPAPRLSFPFRPSDALANPQCINQW